MKQKNYLTSLIVLAFVCDQTVVAQTNVFPSTGPAGIGTTTPNVSSLLDIVSTSKGVLIPRMTKNQRDLIGSPAIGLLIYQTNSTPGFYYYDGASWTAVSPAAANRSLSNLTAPTAINKNLLPGTTNSIDVGSSANSWRNVFAKSFNLDNNTAFFAPGNNNLFAGGGNSLVTGFSNTGFGVNALPFLTSGLENTAVGLNTLFNDTSGSSNTAIGSLSMQSNTIGGFNTAVGVQALVSNTSGSYNVAVGVPSMYSNTTGSANTAVGLETMFTNTTGYSNVAVGAYALFSNTQGHNLVAVGDSALYHQSLSSINAYYNTAVGSKALYANTSGYENTALGSSSLLSNTTGKFNTALGGFALQANTTGDENTAVGLGAMNVNTTGSFNTATGGDAMTLNNTGSFNSAYGSGALHYNTTGAGNTSLGFNSNYFNSTGYSNVSVGTKALFNNTVGHNLVAVGDSALYQSSSSQLNTAIGSKTLYSNTAGSSNTAVGSSSLYSNTTGTSNVAVGNAALASAQQNSYNVGVGDSVLYKYNDSGFPDYMVAVGKDALFNNTTGYLNTAVGGYALKTNKFGYQNSALGTFADVNSNSLFNATAIGYNAIATASNQVMLGNTSVTSVIAGGSVVIVSDKRFKKNIKENVPGLEFIKLLQPVTYNYDVHALNAHISGDATRGRDASSTRNQGNPDEEAINRKEKKSYTGFIAQDVEAAANKLHYDFSGVYKPANDKDAYGLSYSDFVVPLVKAVQQLSDENDTLKKELNDIKMMIANMQNSTTAGSSSQQTSVQVVELSMLAKLEQNVPNPFKSSTTINYFLPINKGNAFINFYSSAGALLKSQKLDAEGKGLIELKTDALPSGTYQYSLIVDGKIVDTKKMVMAK